MKRKNVFICFTGIDGSGKTTQAQLLSERLRERGVRNRYVYNRLVPKLVKPLMLAGKLFFARRKTGDYDDYVVEKSKLLKNPLVRAVFKCSFLLEYYIQAFFKIRLPLLTGNNLVCDRYLYDTVITDLAVFLGYTDDEIQVEINKMRRFLPDPDVLFLLDLPPETAFERKHDMHSEKHIASLRALYLRLAEHYPVSVLDGTQPKDDVAGQVLDIATKKMERSSNHE